MNARIRCCLGDWVRRRWALFVVAILLVACAGDRRPPPAAPQLVSPSDVLPPELEWTFRVDVGRLRSALGNEAFASLGTKLSGSTESPTDRYFAQVLERTDVFVAAVRYDRDLLDVVVAMEGKYAGLEPRAPHDRTWKPAIDLGADVRRYDRTRVEKRSDPARLYVRSNDLVVVVSEAAVDSVEAVIERGAPANPLKPRERGILSFAIRLRSGTLENQKNLAALGISVAGLRSLEGFVEPSTNGFHLETTGEFATEEEAKRTSALLEVIRGELEGRPSRPGVLARHAKIGVEGAYVTLHVEIVREVFDRVLEGVGR